MIGALPGESDLLLATCLKSEVPNMLIKISSSWVVNKTLNAKNEYARVGPVTSNNNNNHTQYSYSMFE